MYQVAFISAVLAQCSMGMRAADILKQSEFGAKKQARILRQRRRLPVTDDPFSGPWKRFVNHKMQIVYGKDKMQAVENGRKYFYAYNGTLYVNHDPVNEGYHNMHQEVSTWEEFVSVVGAYRLPNCTNIPSLIKKAKLDKDFKVKAAETQMFETISKEEARGMLSDLDEKCIKLRPLLGFIGDEKNMLRAYRCIEFGESVREMLKDQLDASVFDNRRIPTIHKRNYEKAQGIIKKLNKYIDLGEKKKPSYIKLADYVSSGVSSGVNRVKSFFGYGK